MELRRDGERARRAGKPIWARGAHRARRAVVLGLGLALALLGGCERPDPEVTLVPSAAAPEIPSRAVGEAEDRAAVSQPLSAPPTPSPFYAGTPTPDPTRPGEGPSGGGDYLQHTVQVGESLGYIAQVYGISIEDLMAANGLENSEFLSVGQSLLVPGTTTTTSPAFKIIPDSELVYGPAGQRFDAALTVNAYGGFLARYQEEVEGQLLSGAEVVQLVADRFSVNPRLLLAVIEYRSGWLTGEGAGEIPYPLGYERAYYEGLYQQLGWAADQLNMGFYGRAEGGITVFDVPEAGQVTFAPGINLGTAGVQFFFAANPVGTYENWLHDVGPDGLYATYLRLFGIPFAYTIDPLWPADLSQPALALPWTPGETWFFTGGPHGGWASGSAWAALDFAPDDGQLGCYVSEAWVTAMADGLVVRSSFGALVLDLDGDGYAGTGWTLTYMHLETRDRPPVGTVIRTGDRLGHPSCEGGFSNGTHVHITRRYNGRWVSADGAIPFVMDDWTIQGLGREYDGLLVKGEEVREACSCRSEGNGITR